MRGRTLTAKLLRQPLERLPPPGDKDDGVPSTRIAAGDGLPKARAGAKHDDRLAHFVHNPPLPSYGMLPTPIKPAWPARAMGPPYYDASISRTASFPPAGHPSIWHSGHQHHERTTSPSRRRPPPGTPRLRTGPPRLPAPQATRPARPPPSTAWAAVYYDLGDPHQALPCFEQALPLYRALGDTAGTASALNNLGMARTALGDAEGALHCYEEALPLRREVGDTRARRLPSTTSAASTKPWATLGRRWHCFDRGPAPLLPAGRPPPRSRHPPPYRHGRRRTGRPPTGGRGNENWSSPSTQPPITPTSPTTAPRWRRFASLRRGKAWWQFWR